MADLRLLNVLNVTDFFVPFCGLRVAVFNGNLKKILQGIVDGQEVG